MHCLVTSYPAYKAKAFGIDIGLVKTVLSKEIIVRGYHKIFGKYPNWFWLNEWFDKIASRKLPIDGDIYILWAGFALHSIRRIRKKNPSAKIILERGSAHIEEQRQFLNLVGTKATVLEAVVQKEITEYAEADVICVPGRFVESSFAHRNVPHEKIFVNPYGVDLNLFSGHHQKISATVFTVGYVGAISKQKNVDGLIESVKNLLKKKYKVRVILAGGIDTNSYSSTYLDQFDFVTYLGSVPQHNLPEIYQQMDAFVLNSVQDGFGMVLLQAMAMGVVPIATVNTGGLDIIEDGVNGFVIPILDNVSLANKIEFFILNKEKRLVMGKRAHDSIINGFSWNDYGNRYMKFLSDIK